MPAGPEPYENRKTPLVVFGILNILIGCVCALFVLLMLVGTTMAPKAGAPAQDLSTLLPAFLMYGGLAVAFVWLGIGSIKARRWARALLLILSWSWLVIGIVTTVVMAFVLPKVMEAGQMAAPRGQPPPPPEAMTIVMVIAMAFLIVFMVILPAVWVFFYRSRHVKTTCEALDPVERWTRSEPAAGHRDRRLDGL